MVKQWLDDDVNSPAWAGRRPVRRVHVALDEDQCRPGALVGGGGAIGDPAPPEPSTVLPVLTVRLRARTGYDDDGAPMFDWTTLVTGPAIVWSEREEFDAEAGMTLVKSRATIGYDGEVTVPETAGVWSDDVQWRVTSVGQWPGRLEFDLERIEGESG